MLKFNVEGQPKVQPSTETLFQGDVDASADQMFQEVVASFKQKFICFDLSHMKCFFSATPRNHDGDAKTNQAEIIKYTGSWTKQDAIYINPDMTQAMKFYGIEGKVTADELKKQAMAHELAHEIWEYQMDSSCKEKILKKAKDLVFDTPYLHHIDDDDPDEELFCEYMAYRITGVWVKI